MIVLLRGINVSGTNKVPMADLRAALSNAGLERVATYIQSGNIALDTSVERDDLITQIEALVEEHFNVSVPAVSVAQSAIESLIAAAPFRQDADLSTSMVYFPRSDVDVSSVEEMDPDKHPGDIITPASNAVYVSYGKGQSKSRLTLAQLERAAGTTLTGRNLRSVAKLAEL